MSKTTSTTLESLNIKPDELNTTMETLEKLAKAGQAGFDLFNTRPMKRLRKAVVPFLEEMRKKFAWDIDAQERKRNLKRKRNTVGLICSLSPNTAAIEHILTFHFLLFNHFLYRHLLYRHLLISSFG